LVPIAPTERQKIGIGVGIGVEKGVGMAFGHEKLDVYRAAIEYVGWVYRFCDGDIVNRYVNENGNEGDLGQLSCGGDGRPPPHRWR
jgi:hypothetical protein